MVSDKTFELVPTVSPRFIRWLRTDRMLVPTSSGGYGQTDRQNVSPNIIRWLRTDGQTDRMLVPTLSGGYGQTDRQNVSPNIIRWLRTDRC